MAAKEETVNVAVIPAGEDEPLFARLPNTLEQYQRLVGGLIELVRLRDGLAMWVNEEGGPSLGDLPLNLVASALAEQPIYGTAVVWRSDPESGECASLTPDDEARVGFVGRARKAWAAALWRGPPRYWAKPPPRVRNCVHPIVNITDDRNECMLCGAFVPQTPPA
jgi:hypothetical protein